MRATTDNPNSEDASSTSEWQVRHIQGHSNSGGTIYYRVAWEPTWEPADRLQHMLPVLLAWNKLHGCSYSRRVRSCQCDPTLEHWTGKVTGRKKVDGMVHYKIQWQVTTEPAVNLKNAQSLVKEYWDKVYGLELGNRGEHEDDSESV
ncbi:uncharacterized protein BDZ83DRAFT_640369 [Colletotrichum acutatum]|uniref:Chromo domain-containing protein n=1 Tax=Glomerella acutata TaxID=27357 RepID=A0AAD8X9A5_GLOAC|nr:uncharacterized protein BDZ83DRAFT_640369 [Colletotrichum acutatum]KAK1710573.1 hypothetical protein BDZ83DRAFT_640369 [Colletotrichum acutatum]